MKTNTRFQPGHPYYSQNAAERKTSQRLWKQDAKDRTSVDRKTNSGTPTMGKNE